MIISRSRLVPLWVAVVVLLSMVGCGGSPIGKDMAGDEPASFYREAEERGGSGVCRSFEAPLEVAGLHLTSFASGEDASVELTEFLGSGLTVLEIYTPCYKGVSGEIVFWIVELGEVTEAKTLLLQMQQHVQNSPLFKDYQELCDSCVEKLHYASYTGDGTVFVHHYFYRKENRVYWVSMSGARQVSLLRCFLPLF